MERLIAKVNVDTGFGHINVAKLSKEIGNMVKVLPALHTFLRYYYTCSCMRKGEIKFYEKIEKSEEYQELFQQFGHLPAVPLERGMNDIQTFVCDIYGKTKISIVNDARYDMFKQRYAPKSMLEPLEKLKAAPSRGLD